MNKIERKKNIEEIREKMCDEYCKYTSRKFGFKLEIILKKCENCPLNELR